MFSISGHSYDRFSISGRSYDREAEETHPESFHLGASSTIAQLYEQAKDRGMIGQRGLTITIDLDIWSVPL